VTERLEIASFLAVLAMTAFVISRREQARRGVPGRAEIASLRLQRRLVAHE
jgi:hypothetical protein